MTIWYEAGYDFPPDEEGLFGEYTINQRSDGPAFEEHFSKIVIYGDESLRNRILKLLNQENQNEP